MPNKIPIPGNAKGQNLAIILVVVAVIAIAFVIINKVFGITDGIGSFFKDAQEGTAEYLNLKDTPEEALIRKRIEEEAARANTSSSPWSPDYYKSSPQGSHLITRAVANDLAKQIWDSVGTFYDDPESGYSALKQLSYKTQISWLADVFNMNYKRDLFSWLKLKYDTDSQRDVLANMIAYVNNLKAY